MDFNAMPTLGSVRERLGYFATTTEEGELNTTLNNAYNYIYELEKKIQELETTTERLQALLYIAESDRDHYHERFDLNQKALDFIFKKKAWWKR
jgi:hypothetical protein